MGSLQTHGHFQMNRCLPSCLVTLERVQKAIDARSYEGRMRFHDDSIQPRQVRRYCLIVAVGYGSRVEEARGVVELHLRDRQLASRELVAGSFHLSRGRTWRCVRGDGSSPQVAHHTAPRAFASRQENGGNAGATSVRRSFVFDDQVLIAPGVGGWAQGSALS